MVHTIPGTMSTLAQLQDMQVKMLADLKAERDEARGQVTQLRASLAATEESRDRALSESNKKRAAPTFDDMLVICGERDAARTEAAQMTAQRDAALADVAKARAALENTRANAASDDKRSHALIEDIVHAAGYDDPEGGDAGLVLHIAEVRAQLATALADVEAARAEARTIKANGEELANRLRNPGPPPALSLVETEMLHRKVRDFPDYANEVTEWPAVELAGQHFVADLLNEAVVYALGNRPRAAPPLAPERVALTADEVGRLWQAVREDHSACSHWDRMGDATRASLVAFANACRSEAAPAEPLPPLPECPVSEATLRHWRDDLTSQGEFNAWTYDMLMALRARRERGGR